MLMRTGALVEDLRFDTLFRVIVAHEFGGHVPAWAADAHVDDDWIVPGPFRDADTIRALTPNWLAAPRSRRETSPQIAAPRTLTR